MSGSRHQPTSALEALVAFVSGSLFAVGLAIAGMTQPAKVVAFLDVAGSWDPSLAFVMMAAIAVYFVAHRAVQKRAAPLVGPVFHLPTRRDIEPRLLVGAGLFGVGWGLGGYCPGPGLSALGTGSFDALLFVASMAGGMLLFEVAQRARTRRVHARTGEPAPELQR
jgi:uncharacterized membrane protein YedE/YeeE